MPSMKMSVPHKLSQEEAARRIKSFVAEMKTQYAKQTQNVEESWSGNTGKFDVEAMGMAVAITVNIEASEILMEAQIPMVALPFKGKIESTVRDRITALLA